MNETKREERIAREHREADAARARLDMERAQLSTALLVVGALLLALGVWFLVFSPSAVTVEGVAVANLQRIAIGEAGSIVGAILFATGSVLRYKTQ